MSLEKEDVAGAHPDPPPPSHTDQYEPRYCDAYPITHLEGYATYGLADLIQRIKTFLCLSSRSPTSLMTLIFFFSFSSPSLLVFLSFYSSIPERKTRREAEKNEKQRE